MARRRKRLRSWQIVILVIALIVSAVIGYQEYKKRDADVYSGDGFEVHFLELGNKYTGDCTYIKAGETDILIDAGSKTSSISTITEYINKYVTDGVLEYVIVTHAHQDHYAGFATNENTDSIFDLYVCEVIIDFSMTNQKADATMYNNYLRERDAEIEAGAKHYTAKECVDGGNNEFELAQGVTLTVLNQKYYHEKASTENDYSVCTLITSGSTNVLLTGDLEEGGEKSLVEMNDLPEVTLYKAGHHGSKTSSSTELMSVIKPEIVCVCCCAGSSEYKAAPENVFPSQKFVNNVSPYTDKVYVTTLCENYSEGVYSSMNGNIRIIFSDAEPVFSFSGSDKKLKDTDWFKANRECPDSWK